MFRTRSEKPEQERLLPVLDKRSLETSPTELRQALAYVLHLRSYWKPEGRTKLIVPASWMGSLTFDGSGDMKCGVACRGAVARSCPFRDVQFESAAETRPPDEEVPRDMVSHLLRDIRMDDCLATFVPRAFEGIPHTRSDVPTMSHSSRSMLWCVEAALVPERASSVTESAISESSRRCLILGMNEPTRTASFDTRSGQFALVSIPEELTRHARFHLTLLASSTQGAPVHAISGLFPEWLVLFGLIYGARHVRIIAYVPHRYRRKSDGIDCIAYIVDELAFHSSITSATACELVLERLRLLSALTTLRRHVHHLSRSLFATISPRDGIRHHSSPLACDQGNSAFKLCASVGSIHQCSSEYSTCPSSVHSCGLNGVSDLKCEEDLSSSCSSLFSSFCSTCSSVLESASSSGSICSEDSNYIEPLSQGDKKSATCLYLLTQTRRREIIVWAQQVIPTEHPIEDNYRMVTSQGLRTLYQVHADRHDQLYTDI